MEKVCQIVGAICDGILCANAIYDTAILDEASQVVFMNKIVSYLQWSRKAGKNVAPAI